MRRPTTFVSLVVLLGVAALTASAAETLSADRQRDVLRDALTAFDNAIEVVRTDPQQARSRFEEAAAGFEALHDAGVRNADLFYNLGNTYFRLGDYGRSVLAYRRGQQLNPAHANLTANLDYARARVTPPIQPSDERRLLRRLLGWHYSTAARTRLAGAVVLSVLGWGLLALRLRFRRAVLTWLGVLGAAGGVACAASVIWEQHELRAKPPAVIVEGQHVLRLGQGEGFDAALPQPLGPGVELRVLERRGDWLKVELRDELTGWIRAAGVEDVCPQ